MKEFRATLWKSTQRVIEQSLDTYKRANPYRYDNPDKYVEILNEFYSAEALRRIALRKKVEADKERMIPAVLHAMSDRTNIINTMVDWEWTYNPKNVPKMLPASIPWIPWPDQIKFIEWIYTRYLTQTRGMIKKTREQGATWVFCEIMQQEWRWSHGFAGGIGSNKLDNVDKRDEPDCIFEKLRALMKCKPPWWFPKGFNWKKHDKIGNMVRYTDNGEMGAQLSGQGGDQIGRGGRRSLYFVDEFASLDNPGEADFALSKNTDCQLDLSTPRGPNFFKQKLDNAEFIYTLHWKNNPMLDENWYARQLKEFSKEIVAQEIDIDFQASVEGLFIEPKWVDAAIGFELKAYGDNQSGLDVAAGGADVAAYANRIGPAVTEMFQWNFANGIDLTHVAAERTNKDKAGVLNYDEVGVGFAVESAFDRTEAHIDFEAYGLNFGGGTSDLRYPEYGDKLAKDIFLNGGTEWLYMLRVRFEKTYEHVNKIKEYPLDELISIPKDHKLTEKFKQEATSMMRFWTPSGKMKRESKEEMRKRGVKSPNVFEAVMFAFVPKDGGRKHVVDTRFTTKEFNIIWDNKGFVPRHCKNYGAICQLDDMSINAICVVWHEQAGIMYIYDELKMDMLGADEIAQKLNWRMRLKEYKLEKIFGNKKMFADEGKKSSARLIKKAFQKSNKDQVVKIREPRKYDPMGSLTIINRLIKEKKMVISSQCKEVARQLSTWRIDKGRAKETGMREGLLMIVSELKKNIPFKEILRRMEYSTKTLKQYEPEPLITELPKFEK